MIYYFGLQNNFWEFNFFENLGKKLAANIKETLSQAFKTSSGTITRITWSQTREII